MSLQGAAMVAVVLVVRTLFLNKLPKGVFMVLWGLVLLRLLVPVALPAPTSVWNLAGTDVEAVFAGDGMLVPNLDAADLPATGNATTPSEPAAPDALLASTDAPLDGARTQAPAEPAGATAATSTGTDTSGTATATSGMHAANPPVSADAGPGAFLSKVELGPWQAAWVAGGALLLAAFIVLYVRGLREFGCSLPVDHPYAHQWLHSHRLRRPLQIRELDRIGSPITFGLSKPTILVPKHFDWNDRAGAALVLEHEYVHIVRFDVVYKALLVAAVCLHWFNPLVWVMYVLANRDIELACDERVVCRLTAKGKTAYAHALIRLLEQRSGYIPLLSGFGKNAVEERILAIAGVRRMTVASACVSAALVVCIPVALATSPMPASTDDLSERLNSHRARTALEQPNLFDVSGTPAGTLPSLAEGPQEVALEGATVIATPYYALTLPDYMTEAGFSWTYDPAVYPRVDSGRSFDTCAQLTVTANSGALAGVEFLVYCVRAPFHTNFDFSPLGVDYMGLLCGYSETNTDWKVWVSLRFDAVAHITPQTFGFTRDAPVYTCLYLKPFVSIQTRYATSTREASGVRIETPGDFSVLVPWEEMGPDWSWAWTTPTSTACLHPTPTSRRAPSR